MISTQHSNYYNSPFVADLPIQARNNTYSPYHQYNSNFNPYHYGYSQPPHNQCRQCPQTYNNYPPYGGNYSPCGGNYSPYGGNYSPCG